MKHNEFSFTDEELRIATRITRQRILDSLPEPEECCYDISVELKEKINQIIIKDRRKTVIRKIRNRAAMIALCILLGISSWLAVDTEARAAFFQWVREVYEDSIIYHFFGEREPAEISKYGITALPQGYEETMRFEESFMHTVFYENTDDMIILTYQIVDESTELAFVNSDMAHTTVDLANYSADFYVPYDPSKTNELVWVDEVTLLTFCISSHLEQDVMLDLANSVTETK